MMRRLVLIWVIYLVREVLFVDTQCGGPQQPLGGAGLVLAIVLPDLHGLQLLLCRHPVALHSEPEKQLCLSSSCLHEVWTSRHTTAVVIYRNSPFPAL